ADIRLEGLDGTVHIALLRRAGDDPKTRMQSRRHHIDETFVHGNEICAGLVAFGHGIRPWGGALASSGSLLASMPRKEGLQSRRPSPGMGRLSPGASMGDTRCGVTTMISSCRSRALRTRLKNMPNSGMLPRK